MPASPRGVRLQRRGRCPHRPAGYVFSVGGDALIAPWGAFTERSEKTDTVVPSASGPMWASAPTKNNVRFQRWGRYPQKQRVFSALGAMPSSPRGVRLQSGQEKRTRPYHRPLRKTTCVFTVGGVTHKNNVCFQRRGRCPHRPVGCVSRAVRKNGHGCTDSHYEKQRAFSPLGALPTKTTCVFSVGGDALIAPWGTIPVRSGKTDTPIPSASGPMWASAPTKIFRLPKSIWKQNNSMRAKLTNSRGVNNPPEHFVINHVLTEGIGPYKK